MEHGRHYKIIENLVAHGRHCLPSSPKFSMTLYCLPCFFTNDVIDLLPYQLQNYQMFYSARWQNVIPARSLWHQCDVIVAMMIDHDAVMTSFVKEHGRQCMPCSIQFSMTTETVSFFKENLRFSQTNNFLKSFNSCFISSRSLNR